MASAVTVQFAVALKLRASARREPIVKPGANVPRVARGRAVVVRATAADAKASEGASLTRNGKKRVVITGLGAVTAHGNDVDDFYAKLLAGKSCISPISEWTPHEEQGTTIAGEIKGFDPEEFMTKKMARRVDPFIAYQIVAAKKALQSAGLPFAKGEELDAVVDKTRAGCLIGSAMGGMHSFSTATENLVKEYPSWIGHKKMNPFCIPFAITNMGSALTAMDLGFMGPNYSISTACATANYAFHSAANHIRKGEADIMIAGGVEAPIIPVGLGGFVACRALSSNNDNFAAASRPWDKNRDGFVMGEGAGLLVLESLESALKRGARIHAEYLGGAITCDAHHMTDPRPDGSGVGLCIEKAVEDAGIGIKEINYINAHATSTLVGDVAEINAVKKAFKGDLTGVKMNGTKSMVGHCLGAAAGVEAVATIMAIKTGWVHPTINQDDPIDEVEGIDTVPNVKAEHKISAAISNSFGFGGHNSCCIFGPYEA
uniref:3-oxoacyl-[acyl-carrier-protein] synthase I, chloroplastic n=1 Tax=Micromonas pusilla TaxID=38833 RepID=A0A7S0IGF4_MICPS